MLKEEENKLTDRFFELSNFAKDSYSQFERIPSGGNEDSNTLDVLKLNNQYFFINKSYIMNKDNESGKLQFQVVNYKLNNNAEFEQNTSSITSHEVITINEQVQLKNASSSLISIV